MPKQLLIKYQKECSHLRQVAADYAIKHGISQATSVFQKEKHWIKYWKTKREDPLFHSGTHGGKRYEKFTAPQKLHIYSLLWKAIQKQPARTLKEY